MCGTSFHLSSRFRFPGAPVNRCQMFRVKVAFLEGRIQSIVSDSVRIIHGAKCILWAQSLDTKICLLTNLAVSRKSTLNHMCESKSVYQTVCPCAAGLYGKWFCGKHLCEVCEKCLRLLFILLPRVHSEVPWQKFFFDVRVRSNSGFPLASGLFLLYGLWEACFCYWLLSKPILWPASCKCYILTSDLTNFRP